MPSIVNIAYLFERFGAAPIEVVPNRCVAVRNRNASCDRCARACTSQAIFIEDNEFRVEPDRCIGCGTCSSICPSGVFAPEDPTDDALMNACLASLDANGGNVVIACSTLLDEAEGYVDLVKVVRVGCLGRVEEGLFMSLALIGAHKITMVKGKCDECSHSKGLEIAVRRSEITQTLLDAWNTSCLLRMASKLPSSSRRVEKQTFDEDRRAFFKDLKQGVKATALKTTEYLIDNALAVSSIKNEPIPMRVNEKGTLPQFIPPYRQRLMHAVERLGAPDDMPIESDLWGSVSIDGETCTACRLCSVFCLTGALARFDEEAPGGDKVFGLTHTPSICTQCGGCEDACVSGALHVGKVASTADIAQGTSIRFPMKKRSSKNAIGEIRHGFASQNAE